MNTPKETPFEEKLDAAIQAALPEIKKEILSKFPELISSLTKHFFNFYEEESEKLGFKPIKWVYEFNKSSVKCRPQGRHFRVAIPSKADPHRRAPPTQVCAR